MKAVNARGSGVCKDAGLQGKGDSSMGNRVRINGKTIGRRGLALLLAVLTTITSWSLDWNALRVQAADNSSELTVPESIPDGGSVTWTYTNPNESPVKVDSVYFKFGAKAQLAYSYDVAMVQSGSTPLTGITGRTVTGLADAPQVESFAPAVAPASVVLEEGDTLQITLTMFSDDGENIDLYKSSTGDYFAVSVSSGSSSNNAVVTITGNDIVNYSGADYLNMGIGQSSQLGYTIDYTRDVTFSSSDTSVATVSPSGLVTGVAAGTATITASTGRDGDTNDTVTVHILNSSFTGANSSYTGREVRPDSSVTVNAATTLSQGTDYTISYSDNVSVGTATATVTGKNSYAGYTGSVQFSIVQRDISELSAAFDNGAATYAIDTAASTVSVTNVTDTGNNVTLAQDIDFTATAAITRSEVVSNTRYYYYTVTINGIGDYTGQVVKTDISTTESAGLAITDMYSYELEGTQMSYDGVNDQRIGVIVYDKNGNEIADPAAEGLSIEYVPRNGGDLKGPGTVDVRITSNIYEGTLSGLSYDIVLDITQMGTITMTDAPLSTSSGTDSFLYTGSEIRPAVSVSAGGRTLIQGTDYTVTYNNNIGSGTEPAFATYTVSGIGMYSGQKTEMFRIVPKLTDAEIVFDGKTGMPANSANSWRSSYAPVYTGSQITPSVRLYFNGTNRSTDINTTSYGDTPYNINVTEGGRVSISTRADSIFGVQNLTAYFGISPKDISAGTLNLGTPGTITYDGTEKELTPYSTTFTNGYKVTLATTDLVKDRDYTVSYSNNTNAGTAIITAIGTGNYTGSLSGSFTISPFDLSNPPAVDDVDLTISSASYDGTPVRPSVTLVVKPDGTNAVELTEGSDYTVAFSNNISVGNAAVATITGKENYAGTITGNFSIVARSIVSSSMTYKVAGSETFNGSDSGASLEFVSTYQPVWNGYERRPSVVVYDGETKLTRGVDFNVTYDHNVDVSSNLVKATATVNGLNNYAGAANVVIKYTIVPCPISADRIAVTTGASGVSSIRDNGASGTPTLAVGTDYVVTPDGHTGAGIKTDTVEGRGNYTGSRTVTYTVGNNLATIDTITLRDPNNKATSKGSEFDSDNPYRVLFMGNNRPAITITPGGGNAPIDVNSSDEFEVTYLCTEGDDPSGFNAGSYVTAIVTAKDTNTDYFGSRNLYYYIVPAKIQTAPSGNPGDVFEKTISATASDYTVKVDDTDNAPYVATSETAGNFAYTYLYSASDITPELELTYSPMTAAGVEIFPSGRYTMTEGVDYTIEAAPGRTFPGSMSANAATFNIIGMGNFDGSINLKFTVSNRNLAEIKNGETRGQIAAIADQVYNGEEHVQPELVVTYDGETLVEGTDYTVAYTNDTTPRLKTEANPPTATVTGINNYTGTLTATYSIVKTELDNTNTTVTINQKYSYDATAHTFSTTSTDENFIDNLVTVRYGTTLLKYADGDFGVTYDDNIYPGEAKLTLTAGSNNKYSVSATNAPVGEYTIYLNLLDTDLYKVVGIENATDYGWDNADPGRYDYSPAHGNVAAKWIFHGGSTELKASDVKIQLLDGAEGNPVVGQYLEKDTNFAETWNSMTIPGTMRSIVLTGGGQTTHYCVGSISIPCEVYGNLAEATVQVAEKQSYTGSAVLPVPTVSFDGQRLPATYYTTQYSSPVTISSGEDDFINVNSGTNNTRTITIQATNAGYYTGENTATYRILYNLNDAVISGVNSTYAHKDATPLPTPVVNITGKTGALTENQEYTVSRQSSNASDATYTAAGSTVTITINPQDEYSFGTKSISYTITGDSITNGTITYDEIPARTYTGSEQRPIPTNVKLNGATITLGTDYFLTYSNNINAGTGLVILNGMGNYTGTKTLSFTINKKDIASTDIEAVFPNAYQYQGGADVYPTTMYLLDRTANKRLVNATDIRIDSVSNATTVSSASNQPTVTTSPLASSIGSNYEGTRTDNFEIVPLDLQSATVTASATTVEYDGTSKTPTLTVRVGERNLVNGTDYEVSSIVNAETGASTPNPKDAGTYHLTITPKVGVDYLVNSKTIDFTINPKQINTADNAPAAGFTATYDYTTEGSSLSKTYAEAIRFEYTGNECRMDSVRFSHNTLGNLTENTDFEISYSDNVTESAPQPSVTITGRGNYTGTIVKDYNIGTDIGEIAYATLSKTSDEYNGRVQKPTVTVKKKSDNSVISTDYYDVKYLDENDDETDPLHAGTYSVVITGKNGYFGQIDDNAGNTPEYTITKKNAQAAYEAGKLTFSLNLTKESNVYVTNYTGDEIEPTVTIYDTQISRSVPVDSSNYTVDYDRNVAVSTGSSLAVASVTMGGDYTDFVENIDFRIKPIPFNTTTRVTVNFPDPSNPFFAYTAEEIEPGVTVTQTIDGAEYTLIDGVDYELSYEDNVVPGDGTITVTGKGNFSPTSTKTQTFRIKGDLGDVFPLNGIVLNPDDNSLTIGDQFYAGSSIDPTVAIEIEGVTLRQGGNSAASNVDFYTTPLDVSEYDENNNIGYVDITGCGSYYTGTCRAAFNLSDDVEELLDVAFYIVNEDGDNEVVSSVPYNGASQKLQGLIVDSNNAAVYTFDATTDGVTYTSLSDGTTCKNVGTINVTVPFTYQGNDYTKTGSYQITQGSLADATISCPAYVTYNGTARKPVVVSYQGNTLTENRDYTIAYTNNTNPGVTAVSGHNVSAGYTITGINNFSSTPTRTGNFIVKVQDMSGLSATPSTNSVKLTWDSKSGVTGYKVRVHDASGALLNEYTIGNKNVSSYTVSNLSPGTSYSFRLIGYVQTTGDTYLSNPDVVVASTSMNTPAITGSVSSSGKPAVGLPASSGAKIIIYRSTTSGSGYGLLAVISDGRRTFIDQSAVSGRTYYYIAKYANVVNGTLVESDASNEIHITAQ